MTLDLSKQLLMFVDMHDESCGISSIVGSLAAQQVVEGKKFRFLAADEPRPSGFDGVHFTHVRLSFEMYHDLNVCIDEKKRDEALPELYRLGFNVVAFTTRIQGTTQLRAEHCPKEGIAKRWVPPDPASLTPSGGNAREKKKHMTVLQRATLVIEDPGQLVLLTSSLLNKFDIVAVEPSSEKLLQQCLQFDFDLISLCLSKKQQFYIKKPQANVATEKGIYFEVSFADALHDRASRRFVISNACALSRATNQKNIILSSGAKRLMELRGPHDTINLGMIFDLPYECGRKAVTNWPEKAAAHGDIRANTYKGIVRVVGDAPMADQDEKSGQAGVSDSRAMTDI